MTLGSSAGAATTRSVIKQRWVLIMPGGAACENGHSYHLTEAHRVAMVAQVAARLATDLQAERDEPIGDPEEVRVTEEFYGKLESTARAGGFGIRVK